MFREIPKYSRFSRFVATLLTISHTHTHTHTHTWLCLNNPFLCHLHQLVVPDKNQLIMLTTRRQHCHVRNRQEWSHNWPGSVAALGRQPGGMVKTPAPDGRAFPRSASMPDAARLASTLQHTITDTVSTHNSVYTLQLTSNKLCSHTFQYHAEPCWSPLVHQCKNQLQDSIHDI